MAHQYPSLVAETGVLASGVVTVSGAVTGYRTFAAALTDADTVDVVLKDANDVQASYPASTWDETAGTLTLGSEDEASGVVVDGAVTVWAASDSVLRPSDIGTTPGTVAAGDDSRLSDARSPTAHKTTHQSGGADAIKLDDLATTSAHGLLPKLGGGTSNFLRADGTWAEPPVTPAWDGDIADIDLDGGTDISADLADADLILVDDGASGTNRKSALSRIWTYISAKIAALTDISGWAAVLDEDNMSSDSAIKVPTQQSVKAYVDANTGDPIAISDTTPAEATSFWFKSDTGQLFVSYDGTYVEPASGVSIGMPTDGVAGQMLAKVTGDDFDTEWTNGPILSDYTETTNTETLTADATLDLADGPIQFLTINPAGASVELTMPAAAAGKSLTLIVTNNASKAHTWAASPAIVWMSESDDATPPTPAADGDRTSYGFISDGTVWLGWLTGKEVSA